ncbi:hypothetical protein HK105_200041 [Polyrhizophydium stewartii]|uniref:Mitochondrial adapter protein MCP1 transmembrane domain-containing protein n=1 Tax=Polyrhizophydium stewartii TaxID=2732419 RepID=A0ABR4NKB4_9FUNG
MSPADVDRVLSAVQAGSGLTFATFAVLHLTGHSLAGVRYEYASSALYAFREYYHIPAVEVVVVGGAMVVHAASSAARVALRTADSRGRPAPATPARAAAGPGSRETKAEQAARQRAWHRLAGYTLGLFMVGHVTATRLVPLWYLPDPSVVDLTYASYPMTTHPGFFHAYYLLLAFAGMYHTAYGISSALRTLHVRVPGVSLATWDRVTTAMAGLSAATVLALAGTFEALYIPRAKLWAQLEDKLLSLVTFGLLGG